MPMKKDSNQPAIERGLRDVGATVISTHEVKKAFDMIVIFRGAIFLAEIKNPDYAPKTKPVESMLTEGEQQCKADIERAGGTYHIWLTLEQALKEIGETE